ARNSATALSGYASARITADGQAVQADISLAATGTVSGRVFRSNGSTPVGGVQLSLRLNDSTSAAATTVSDASGNYSFASVPVGEFTVDATELATG
ncbi:carboxypeptidase-like regulatory domain-containing protein, partial [Salmonella enterica]|nr:carboxypeptidase-like regulatory domain-containing protein [Salmonella enterica]